MGLPGAGGLIELCARRRGHGRAGAAVCGDAITNAGHVVGHGHRGARPGRAGPVLLRAARSGRSATRSPARPSSPLREGPSSWCSSRRPTTSRRSGRRSTGEQRPMMHFDFQVGDLDSAVAEAVALGATLAAAPAAGQRPGAARPGRPPVLPLPRRRLTTSSTRNRWLRVTAEAANVTCNQTLQEDGHGVRNHRARDLRRGVARGRLRGGQQSRAPQASGGRTTPRYEPTPGVDGRDRLRRPRRRRGGGGRSPSSTRGRRGRSRSAGRTRPARSRRRATRCWSPST